MSNGCLWLQENLTALIEHLFLSTCHISLPPRQLITVSPWHAFSLSHTNTDTPSLSPTFPSFLFSISLPSLLAPHQPSSPSPVFLYIFSELKGSMPTSFPLIDWDGNSTVSSTFLSLWSMPSETGCHTVPVHLPPCWRGLGKLTGSDKFKSEWQAAVAERNLSCEILSQLWAAAL